MIADRKMTLVIAKSGSRFFFQKQTLIFICLENGLLSDSHSINIDLQRCYFSIEHR